MAKLGRLSEKQKSQYIENVRTGYRRGRSRNDIADYYHYGKNTVQFIIRNYMSDGDKAEHERNKFIPYLNRYQIYDKETGELKPIAHVVRLRRDPSYKRNLNLAWEHYNRNFRGASKERFVFVSGTREDPSVFFERLRKT